MDMNEQTIGPAERAHYLAAIERVATKLADLARDQRMNEQAPYAQDFLMARHIHLLLEPAIALMPRHLQAAFLAGFLDRLRRDHGLCTICGTPKQHPDALACVDCLLAEKAIEADLGLGDFAAAFRPVAEPDPRD
jgi:hypothetical protein